VYHLEANNGSTDALEDCTFSVVAADSAYSCFEPGTVALEAGPKRGRLAECLWFDTARAVNRLFEDNFTRADPPRR
jgi:hypothetical protein